MPSVQRPHRHAAFDELDVVRIRATLCFDGQIVWFQAAGENAQRLVTAYPTQD